MTQLVKSRRELLGEVTLLKMQKASTSQAIAESHLRVEELDHKLHRAETDRGALETKLSQAVSDRARACQITVSSFLTIKWSKDFE